jgi:hypothetical protein
VAPPPFRGSAYGLPSMFSTTQPPIGGPLPTYPILQPLPFSLPHPALPRADAAAADVADGAAADVAAFPFAFAFAVAFALAASAAPAAACSASGGQTVAQRAKKSIALSYSPRADWVLPSL